ncbi:hypothetical protein SAMN05428939_0854 [Streptomyces sp. TLI_105]|nr:hypothetical protein SAMN05428939_0854 [Streptomyces sp. TLI_105]
MPPVSLVTALTREAGFTAPELVEALYERHRDPAAWHPYPNTETTLRALRDRGSRWPS